MPRTDRREAARARLVTRFGENRSDADLIRRALGVVAANVSTQGAISEAEANELAFDETERMRREKRERSKAGAGRRR